MRRMRRSGQWLRTGAGSVLIAQAILLGACGGGGGGGPAATSTAPGQPPAQSPPQSGQAPQQVYSPPPTSPGITLCTSTLAFPLQAVGSQSAVQTVLVTNTGTTPLANMAIALSGADSASFTQTNDCGATLNDAASCTVTVSFTPQSAGAKAANVVVSGSSLSPVSIALSGSGGASD